MKLLMTPDSRKPPTATRVCTVDWEERNKLLHSTIYHYCTKLPDHTGNHKCACGEEIGNLTEAEIRISRDQINSLAR